MVSTLTFRKKATSSGKDLSSQNLIPRLAGTSGSICSSRDTQSRRPRVTPRWLLGISKASGQPAPVLCHLHSTKALPAVQGEPPKGPHRQHWTKQQQQPGDSEGLWHAAPAETIPSILAERLQLSFPHWVPIQTWDFKNVTLALQIFFFLFMR